MYQSGDRPNALPISHTTSAFVNKEGKVWIGLEKAGLCLYRRSRDDFSCMPASDEKENAIPSATVEHIFEGNDSSLWLAMNNSGFVRISPKLEKFTNLEARLNSSAKDYYKRTLGALVR